MNEVIVDPLLRFPNVVVENADKMPQEKLAKIHFRSNHMRPLVSHFALAQPTWTFVLIDRGTINPEQVVCEKIDVICGPDKLGSITAEWYRGEYAVGLRSHRTNTNRGVQRTGDFNRAVALAKKLFVPRSQHELIDVAIDAAKRALQEAQWKFGRERASAAEELAPHMRMFALANESAFAKHLVEKNKANLTKVIDKYKEASMHMTTVEEVKEWFDKGKTALVLLDSGEYIVKMGDDAQVYNDVTLPDHFRGKLGMLKLVNEGQIIEKIGCRVNPNVFVVVTLDEGVDHVE